jgi:hypothetical protein
MCRFSLRIGFLLLVVAIVAHPCLAQQEVARRALVNAVALPGDQWETGDGASVSTDGKQLTISLSGQKSSWAATREKVPYDPAALVIVLAKQRAKVQAEFFDGGGHYITTTTLRDGQHLSQGLPSDADPKTFRLKFWIEGSGTKLQFRRAEVVSDLKWKEPGVRVIQKFGPDAHIDADKGAVARNQPDALVGKLDGSRPFSAIHIAEKIKREPNMVFLIDISALTGGMSVQALTWAEDGTQLKPVDLLKDLTAAGTYEVSMKDIDEKLPEGTHKISLKLWLNGKNAEVHVPGIYWGVTAEK